MAWIEYPQLINRSSHKNDMSVLVDVVLCSGDMPLPEQSGRLVLLLCAFRLGDEVAVVAVPECAKAPAGVVAQPEHGRYRNPFTDQGVLA